MQNIQYLGRKDEREGFGSEPSTSLPLTPRQGSEGHSKGLKGALGHGLGNEEPGILSCRPVQGVLIIGGRSLAASLAPISGEATMQTDRTWESFGQRVL